MSLTVVSGSLERFAIGDRYAASFQALLDNSYPTGGYSVPPAEVGLNRFVDFIVVNEPSGFEFDFDYVNNKLKILQASGGAGTTGATASQNDNAINQTLPVIANTGNLLAVPAIVQNVYSSAGAVTGPFLIVPSTVAPASGQASVNMATGAITFNAADAVTQMIVTFLLLNDFPHTHTFAFAAAAGVEVPNGTDLSMVPAFRVIGIGF